MEIARCVSCLFCRCEKNSLANPAYRRVYWSLQFQRIKVYDGAAGGCGQEADGLHLNHQREAERTDSKWRESLSPEACFQRHASLSKTTSPRTSQTKPPAGDRVSDCGCILTQTIALGKGVKGSSFKFRSSLWMCPQSVLSFSEPVRKNRKTRLGCVSFHFWFQARTPRTVVSQSTIKSKALGLGSARVVWGWLLDPPIFPEN